MTPNELYYYSLPIKSETYDLTDLQGCHYNHFPEIPSGQLSEIPIGLNKDVRFQIHYEANYDSRRFWRLASVWYKNEPFMIVQNAGREGDDHKKRWVTDNIVYGHAIQYIESLRMVIRVSEGLDYVEPWTDIGDLFNFYGHDVRRDEPWSF